MENIARFAVTRFDSKRIEAGKAYLKIRWRRILLELCVLAAYALCTSLIARG
jgi:hypothetical protein